MTFRTKRTTLDSVEVIVLADAARKTEATIVPTLGNMGYAMQVKGRNVLYTPEGGLAKFRARPSLAGIPFLAPWADRRGAAVTRRLEFWKYPDMMAQFPFAHTIVEPMAVITNAMNMAQSGLYNELQSIPPGGEWRESFWVGAAGF